MCVLVNGIITCEEKYFNIQSDGSSSLSGQNIFTSIINDIIDTTTDMSGFDY